MKNYYLIRRNLEQIMGPMTLDEFQEAFEKMECGLQDEIAGHCGRWIVLEDSSNLKKHYPDVYQAIKYKGGHWVSGIFRNDSTMQPIILPEGRKWKTLLRVGLLTIVLGFLGYKFKDNLVDTYFLYFDESILVRQIRELSLQNDKLAFQSFITSRESRLIKIVSRNKESQILPYLRWYAFLDKGKLVGLQNNILMGVDQFPIPEDCSKEKWTRVFIEFLQEENEFNLFQNLQKNLWLKLIVADFHWISIRRHNDWIYPPNPWSACILMADFAFKKEINNSIFSEHFQKNYEKLGESILSGLATRLDLGKKMVLGEKVVIDPKSLRRQSFIDLLNCFEVAKTILDLGQCYVPDQVEPESREYLFRRYFLNYLRLLTYQTKVQSAYISYIKNYLPTISFEDPIYGFDYTPELEFARFLLRNQGDVEKSITQISDKYPKILFSLYSGKL